MLRQRRPPKPCPECQRPLQRRHRRLGEHGLRDVASGRTLYRYRCRDPQCSWQGLLPSRRRTRGTERLRRELQWLVARLAPSAAWPRWASAAVVTAAAVAMVGATVPLVRQSNTIAAAGAAASAGLPAGHSHDGVPLPERHPWLRPVSVSAGDPRPAAVEPLAMRRDCAWGEPGRSPYQGTVEQALLHARLPAEVAEELARRVASRDSDDRLEISNQGIHAARLERQFEPRRMAMAFGRTMCLNTRVNFKAGHIEQADLYEVTDRVGQRHAVMVPDVCGNVTVLGARGERRRTLAAGANADPAAAGGADWQVLVTGALPDDAAAVPEPGLLSLVAAGLAALAMVRRRRR